MSGDDTTFEAKPAREPTALLATGIAVVLMWIRAMWPSHCVHANMKSKQFVSGCK